MFEAMELSFRKNRWGEEKGHLICPRCGRTVAVKVHRDTLLVNFPLYCWKCNKPTNIGYSGGVEKVT